MSKKLPGVLLNKRFQGTYTLENKIFVSTNIEGDAFFQYTATYFHHAWTNYGISVGSEDPPKDL